MSTSSLLEDKGKPSIAEKKFWIKCLKTFYMSCLHWIDPIPITTVAVYNILWLRVSIVWSLLKKRFGKKTLNCEKQMAAHWPSPDLAAISLAGWRPGSIMNLVKIGDQRVRVIFCFGGHLYFYLLHFLVFSINTIV